MYLRAAIPFSVFTGLVTVLGYEAVFFYTLRSLPHSFTLGEASVVVQGFILLMYNAILFLFGYATHLPSDELQQVSVVVEVWSF